MNGTIVSVGYEGRSIASLLVSLAEHGVTALVDVRLTPWSHKKGYSKSMLSYLLESRGIRYMHEPSLGNPKDNRDSFRDGDATTGRARFMTQLSPTGHDAIDRLVDLAEEETAAVMCFERVASFCHRAVVIGEATARMPALQVINLP